jgi:hypothetical protein
MIIDNLFNKFIPVFFITILIFSIFLAIAAFWVQPAFADTLTPNCIPGDDCTYKGRTVFCNSGSPCGGNHPDLTIYRYHCCENCTGYCWDESRTTCVYDPYCH